MGAIDLCKWVLFFTQYINNNFNFFYAGYNLTFLEWVTYCPLSSRPFILIVTTTEMWGEQTN